MPSLGELLGYDGSPRSSVLGRSVLATISLTDTLKGTKEKNISENIVGGFWQFWWRVILGANANTP